MGLEMVKGRTAGGYAKRRGAHRTGPVRSATVIAELLMCEGFTDHLAAQMEKYWKNSAGLVPKQQKHIAELEAELSRITRAFPVGDRLILGKFIGLHKKMAFDTGLRIGIMTFLGLKEREEIEEQP